jgi:signal transduction histidine kinase
MYPILIGLPAVTLLIWIIVGHGFGPLKRLAADVHRRDPDNLDPIIAPYAPVEVNSLVTELNVLLTRLKHKIDNERHFVADAAHELRTPLAGLKAQAEVALGARNDSERTRALNNILVGVDRASHLVNQLLTLSRLDESGNFARETVDLDQKVRAVILDSLEGADQRGVELSFEPNAGSATQVHGNPDALYVLVRNLVDNAIKYSPSGTLITISTHHDVNGVELTVCDQGPGIPLADRETVFDRFHRRGVSDAYGSGLGLSIVRRVMELHGGSISLAEAPGGGLQVNVAFPASVHNVGKRDPTPAGARHGPGYASHDGELSRA